jgi:hypothetical protein
MATNPNNGCSPLLLEEMKKLLFILLLTIVAIAACNTAQDKISAVSEKVGETGGAIVKSVSTGVEKAFDLKVELAPVLQSRGISVGKIKLSNDSVGTDNKVSVYLIFSKDFKGTLTMKAFDAKQLEMGRARAIVTALKDEARFIDFSFDPRTNIDTDSKLTIE